MARTMAKTEGKSYPAAESLKTKRLFGRWASASGKRDRSRIPQAAENGTIPALHPLVGRLRGACARRAAAPCAHALGGMAAGAARPAARTRGVPLLAGRHALAPEHGGTGTLQPAAQRAGAAPGPGSG